MQRLLPLVVLLLSLAGRAAAQGPALPEDCLWLEHGRVRVQGEGLRIPPQMQAAEKVAALFSVGPRLVAWTEEQRDEYGGLQTFRLHLADLAKAENRALIGTPSFLAGGEWWLEAVNLDTQGGRLLLRLRESGTGYFSETYAVSLAPPHEVTPSPGTLVWDSASADGSRRAVATWGLADDCERLGLPETQCRFASLLVASRGEETGRLLWQVAHHDQVPPWAERYITSVAVSPDGGHLAYVNPLGLWLVSLEDEAPPTAWLALAPGSSVALAGVVWARDGAGIYFTARRGWAQSPSIYYLARGKTSPVRLQPGAERLCLVQPALP